MNQLLADRVLLSPSDRMLIRLMYTQGLSRRAVARWLGITEQALFKRLKRLNGHIRMLASSEFLTRRYRLTPADRRIAELYFARGLSLRRLSRHPASGGQSPATLCRRIKKIEAKLFSRQPFTEVHLEAGPER